MPSLFTPVLCISGSDSTGGTGIQADIRNISAMGGQAITAVSSITYFDDNSGLEVYDVPTEILRKQLNSIMTTIRPHTAKVGLLRSPEMVIAVREELQGCHNIILAPGINTSTGLRLVDDSTIKAIKDYLISESRLLIIRCSEAQLLTGIIIRTQQDMPLVAQHLINLGAKSVMLRGALFEDDTLTSLFYDGKESCLFSSHNTSGWQMHGVSGALSSAIATRIALGDTTIEAIKRAHDYLCRQIVYSVNQGERQHRPEELYNSFIALVASYYRHEHKVYFYAQRLSVTPRYLAASTHQTIGRSPKHIIDSYLIEEAKAMLSSTNLTIQEISNQLGFSSQSVFSRFFSSYTSQSPASYRNANTT